MQTNAYPVRALTDAEVSRFIELAENHIKTGRSKTDELSAFFLSLDEGKRDDSLFHISKCCYRGGMHQDDLKYLVKVLAKACNPPLDPETAYKKVSSSISYVDKADNTERIREWCLSTTGIWKLNEMYQELGIKGVEQQTKARVYVGRLKQEGILVNEGKSRGTYRLVEGTCDKINWMEAAGEEYKIKLPLGLEEQIKLYPGNIVIIAGDQNAGKTAFLLNLAEQNMRDRKVFYYSSEMGAEETKTRITSFYDVRLQEWAKVNFFERSGNFPDVIQKDDLNIIDYLEISDAFYEIGGILKDIHNKLRKGVAIIAVQKAPGARMGRGASFSLEKPRLYLALSGNEDGTVTLEIVKAKFPRNPKQSANYMKRKFLLSEGCIFSPLGGWYRDSQHNQETTRHENQRRTGQN